MCAIENVWLASALWLGLALAASIISIRVAMSVALIEIMVGAVAGNIIGLTLTEWINFLAGFGAILLTFLAVPAEPDDLHILTLHKTWANGYTLLRSGATVERQYVAGARSDLTR